MKRIAVVGSVTVDEQVHWNRPPVFQLGGVATYGCLAHGRTGTTALSVCTLGGPWQTDVLAAMRSVGLEARVERSLEATCFRNHLFPDGGRRQELLAVARGISASHLEAGIKDVDVVQLGPVHPGCIGDDALRFLTETSLPMALDVQGYLRSAGPGPVVPSLSPSLEPALCAATLVKADRDEWSFLMDSLGVDEDELMHRCDLTEAVVTNGPDGGYVLIQKRARIPFDAAPVEQTVDTTGAGDVFFSVYISRRLLHGDSIENSCLVAAGAAAAQVAGRFIRPSSLRLSWSAA